MAARDGCACACTLSALAAATDALAAAADAHGSSRRMHRAFYPPSNSPLIHLVAMENHSHPLLAPAAFAATACACGSPAQLLRMSELLLRM